MKMGFFGGGGYSDIPSSSPSPDLEDGGGDGNDDDDFNDEDGGGGNDNNPAGVMRKKRRKRRKGGGLNRNGGPAYESVTTTGDDVIMYDDEFDEYYDEYGGYYERKKSNCCSTAIGKCFGFITGFSHFVCQTVVIVTALLLIGAAGFLIGSAKPDLLVATINATTGFDFNEYAASAGIVAPPSPVDMEDVKKINDLVEAGNPDAIPVVCADGNGTTSMINGTDAEIADILATDVDKKTKKSVMVRYDPSVVLANSLDDNDIDDDGKVYNNPFNTYANSNNNNNNKSPFLIPPHPFTATTTTSSMSSSSPVGFLKNPHLVDDRLVFLSEGDAYVTKLASDSESILPASKVTTTIGNVLDPKWHPTLPILAFTATYTGRRDVYLLDLSPNKNYLKSSTPVRLTYWDVGAGVSGVVGWVSCSSTSGSNSSSNYFSGQQQQQDANCLVFRAMSNVPSLPDYRLYMIHLGTTATTASASSSSSASSSDLPKNNNNYDDPPRHRHRRRDLQSSSSSSSMKGVLEIEPIPLAQATDATRFNNCWYFVRVKQSSHTIRYVGGTAENLWMYCDGNDDVDAPSQRLLNKDKYKGTSKSPQLYHGTNNQHYLLFLTDRVLNTEQPDPHAANRFVPDRMNVWALPLRPNPQQPQQSSSSPYSDEDIVQITDTSCDFEGRTIQEYSIDSITGNLIVRIGADLYVMSQKDVQSKIEKKSDTNSNSNKSYSGGGSENKSNTNGNSNNSYSGGGSIDYSNNSNNNNNDDEGNTDGGNGRFRFLDQQQQQQQQQQPEEEDGTTNDANIFFSNSENHDGDETTVSNNATTMNDNNNIDYNNNNYNTNNNNNYYEEYGNKSQNITSSSSSSTATTATTEAPDSPYETNNNNDTVLFSEEYLANLNNPPVSSPSYPPYYSSPSYPTYSSPSDPPVFPSSSLSAGSIIDDATAATVTTTTVDGVISPSSQEYENVTDDDNDDVPWRTSSSPNPVAVVSSVGDNTTATIAAAENATYDDNNNDVSLSSTGEEEEGMPAVVSPSSFSSSSLSDIGDVPTTAMTTNVVDGISPSSQQLSSPNTAITYNVSSPTEDTTTAAIAQVENAAQIGGNEKEYHYENGTNVASSVAAVDGDDNIELLPGTVPSDVPEYVPDTLLEENSDVNITFPNIDDNFQPSVSSAATSISVKSLEMDDTLGIDNITDLDEGNINSTEPPAKYYYEYNSPELVPRSANDIDDDGEDHYSGHSSTLKRLPVAIYSDFQNEQERIVPVDIMKHFVYGDVFETITGSTQFLLTLRGQLWVAPVVDDGLPEYKDAGRNMPARRYRVAPGATMGGLTRILAAMHVPNPVEDDKSDRRLAVILATDPLTFTAEHAFYLIETQPGASPLFVDVDRLPKPFLGGSTVSGGSTKDGGLGSVKPDTLAMSPCGNRMAWSDTDGRIVVMNLPQYQKLEQDDSDDEGDGSSIKFVVLPKKNELDEPMIGDEVTLVFSPGGRYLSIEHNARNQFSVISIADLGDPLGNNEEENKIADIKIGRIVQATSSRFNSISAYWGKSPTDVHNFSQNKTMAKLFSLDEPDDISSTTLYYLSDRDIKTDVSSPWGTRQRMPHFDITYGLYAISLQPKDFDDEQQSATSKDNTKAAGQFRGGGVEELHVEALLERMDLIKALLDEKAATSTTRRERRSLAEKLHPLAGAFGHAEKAFLKDKKRRRFLQLNANNSVAASKDDDDNDDEAPDTADDHLEEAIFPKDMDIDFGPIDLTFARSAYRLASIPEGTYSQILCQNPDGSLILVSKTDLAIFVAEGYPSDKYEMKSFKAKTRYLVSAGLSANREYIFLIYSPDGAIRVVPNTDAGRTGLLADDVLDDMVVDKKGMHLSIWPALEYRQMYDDAWRMLRDYFYNPDMTGIDWPAIHRRYLPLVERCSKREELDDVLAQMSSELSALHVFVYGGEYNSPTHHDDDLVYVNEVGSLGATLKRTPAWKGYTITSIPKADPEFTSIDQSTTIYSPLSDQSLRLSGQRGLEVGDVIVGVNGESVMSVPDIHMLLRGTAGTSVRLDVLRLKSGELIANDNTIDVNEVDDNDEDEATVESVITVPISPDANSDLLYSSWEWKTQQMADELAEKAGISVGYVHLRTMSGSEAEDAFARGFFPNYKKQGFIIDVRHNRGGNIDSWVLDVLQRKAWQYWQSRDFDVSTGGIDWDMHFAFRGHVIVLVDEKSSSDAEGVSRGIKELGLGKLIGTRTWGGGIWLSSDNHLVDGGIATAPEIGTYNEHTGWGMGIEQMGVDPDIEVDNDPHETYNGRDRQLEHAISELKKWIEDEPVVLPKPKGQPRDMTMGDRECKV